MLVSEQIWRRMPAGWEQEQDTYLFRMCLVEALHNAMTRARLEFGEYVSSQAIMDCLHPSWHKLGFLDRRVKQEMWVIRNIWILDNWPDQGDHYTLAEDFSEVFEARQGQAILDGHMSPDDIVSFKPVSDGLL